MGRTNLQIHGERFHINGQPVYVEIAGSNPNVHGLLMNARFIQGVFDGEADRERYHRFGRRFDPDANTNDLIAALPEWYRYGLRAITVGFQGGGPCFTVPNGKVDNNPFGADGTRLDPAYAERMDRIIRAADKLGMVVIVSYLYPGQAGRLQDGKAVLNAVRTASRSLREGAYTNVIVEVCNEHNVAVHGHPLLYTPEGMVALLEIARTETGGMPVGCSGTGNFHNAEVCRESDVILIHGNGLSRQDYYNKIAQVRQWAPGKPVVCNEDSPAIGQLEVAWRTRTSWGYYNNMTKQEPPANWGVTRGEDQFFAYRMAQGIGIDVPPIAGEDHFYLQGLEPEMTVDGRRWIRLASLYPERIDYVDFCRNGELVYTCYVEPFTVNYFSNWKQTAWESKGETAQWEAQIHLADGRVLVRRAEG
jgi:hypothetical protein